MKFINRNGILFPDIECISTSEATMPEPNTTLCAFDFMLITAMYDNFALRHYILNRLNPSDESHIEFRK